MFENVATLNFMGGQRIKKTKVFNLAYTTYSLQFGGGFTPHCGRDPGQGSLLHSVAVACQQRGTGESSICNSFLHRFGPWSHTNHPTNTLRTNWPELITRLCQEISMPGNTWNKWNAWWGLLLLPQKPRKSQLCLTSQLPQSKTTIIP